MNEKPSLRKRSGAEMKASAEGKTVSEAYSKALSRLEELVGEPIDREEAEVIVISEGSKGFLGMGSTMAKVEVLLPAAEGAGAEPEEIQAETPEQAAEIVAASEAAQARLRELLEKTLESFGLEGSIRIVEKDDELAAKIDGGDLGLFIGRHGQTIDAIEYMANVLVYRKLPTRKRISIDAENYRDRRIEILQALADRGANEILKGKHRYELKPMSAAERRIVHMHLQDRDGVETTSEGNEPYRKVVIIAGK